MTEKNTAIVITRDTLVNGKLLQPPKKAGKVTPKDIHEVPEKIARELVAMEKAVFYREPEKEPADPDMDPKDPDKEVKADLNGDNG